MITIEERCQESSLVAKAEWVGGDLWVLVSGGDAPHIGSVAVAVPRDSLSGDGTKSATVSTINITGHMDNHVGDKFAKRLASVFSCHVSVSCGIHFDNARPDDIEKVVTASNRLLEQLESALHNRLA